MEKFTKENTIIIGDSHAIHSFDNLFRVVYLRDITLNKLRQIDKPKYSLYEDKITYETYFLDLENGEDIFNIVENYENVIFSIGEIDVRFHLYKFTDYVEKIENLIDKLGIYLLNFKNNVHVVNIIPPTKISVNSQIRRDITIEFNSQLSNIKTFNVIDINTILSDENSYLNDNFSSDTIHLNSNGSSLVQKKITN